MRRAVVPLVTLAVSGTVLPTAPASAHDAEIDACLTRADADFCEDTFSYVFGDTVILEGTVSPRHDRALALLKAPGADRWERFGWATVSDSGSVRVRWRTHRRDAVQDAPYLLRWRIPGHGKSDVVEAFVLFGE